MFHSRHSIFTATLFPAHTFFFNLTIEQKNGVSRGEDSSEARERLGEVEGRISRDNAMDDARLKKEQKVKERKRKRKEEKEAHDYTFIKVVRDQDLAEQIGKDIFFDLVDCDKVRSFPIQKQTAFSVLKGKVAKEFGIPVGFMRFWLWAKRRNLTYRPDRPLSSVEESQSVSHLGKTNDAEWKVIVESLQTLVSDMGGTSDQTKNAELILFLEINLTTDLKPIPLPKKTNADILLFLKLYDPEKEELRYVRSLFVKAFSKTCDILPKLKEMAGFTPTDEIELFEEIKFEPSVMCEHIDKRLTFRERELEDGDIICYQKVLSKEDEKHYRFSDVTSFFNHVQSLQVSTVQDRLASERSLRAERNLIAAERDNLQADLNALQAQMAVVIAERNAAAVERDRFERERDEARQQGYGGLGQAFCDVAYYSGKAMYFQTQLMTHASHVSIPPYSQVVSDDKLSGYCGTSKITISDSVKGKRLRTEGPGEPNCPPQ